MFTPDSDAENKAMLIASGVPLETLNVIRHSWGLDDLISGRIDAQTAYQTKRTFPAASTRDETLPAQADRLWDRFLR
jgi:hypothetical protein